MNFKYSLYIGPIEDGVVAKPCPVDSMREAMLTVSPNKQYLGIRSPTTAATHGPAVCDIQFNQSVIYLFICIRRKPLKTERIQSVI